ncbi:MAG: hypothetical protein WCK57_11170 [Verrucomicrobiae bacterium]
MTDKLVELVSRVEKKSISDALAWEVTANPDEFQTILASFVVRIREHFEAGDSLPDYEIKIIGANGNTLETISNGDLVNILHGNEIEGRHPYAVMKSIFTKAKRQALGVDKAIDNILSELE